MHGSYVNRHVTEPLWWKARQLHLVASTGLAAIRRARPHRADSPSTATLDLTEPDQRAVVIPDETYHCSAQPGPAST